MSLANLSDAELERRTRQLTDDAVIAQRAEYHRLFVNQPLTRPPVPPKPAEVQEHWDLGSPGSQRVRQGKPQQPRR